MYYLLLYGLDGILCCLFCPFWSLNAWVYFIFHIPLCLTHCWIAVVWWELCKIHIDIFIFCWTFPRDAHQELEIHHMHWHSWFPVSSNRSIPQRLVGLGGEWTRLCDVECCSGFECPLLEQQLPVPQDGLKLHASGDQRYEIYSNELPLCSLQSGLL